MIVVWSDSAIDDIQEIHDYFCSTANLKVANKIIDNIVDKSILLENNPRIGQIEELLEYKQTEIRYLVESNYKIVYWIEENNVIIATVFDCRQDPKKLKNLNL